MSGSGGDRADRAAVQPGSCRATACAPLGDPVVEVPTRFDEAALIGATLAYGVVLSRVIPEAWHVPANAAAAVAAAAFARRAGATSADCGLSLGTLRRALVPGATAAAMVGGGILVASLPARTSRLFGEDRIAGHASGRAAYEMLVRIPLGTALSEEVLFRGAMLGVMLRRHGPAAAVARTSLCFGVWHVLPTIAALRSAELGRQFGGGASAAAAVGGVVAVTTVAGAALAALRLRSGSIAASALAHATLNATAYLAARRAAR